MIKIHNLHKLFGKNVVLNGASLDIPSGTLQILLGSNGAGKTTMVNIVAGLMKSDEGQIMIDNEQITTNSYKYRSKVGYVFEEPMFVEKFTAREQLMFTGKMYGLTRKFLNVRVKNLCDFFDLPYNDKKYIETYSKGMRSKVSLAMAIIHKPKYLILDEPFDGVDFVSVQNINRLLLKMKAEGTTIFITSHQYDVIASLGDKFALLQNGQIQFNFTMDELQKKAHEFSSESMPVKAYLESIMAKGKEKDLSKI